MLSIELIVASGSRAGTAVPIQVGYYMIGRHGECQIRPKSRSVSRRHCLLQHREKGFAIFDLQSTKGTFVNDEQLEPHSWRQLRNGDQIRCGKVTFGVAIKQLAMATAGTAAPSSDHASAGWHESDIAHFLESEDDADREHRYGQIRSRTGSPADQNETANLTAYEDTPLKKDDRTPVESSDSANRKKGKQAKPLKIPNKKQRAPGTAGTRFSFSLAGLTEGEQWKLVGAVVLATAFLGFFSYQTYHYSSGPSIQLIDQID